MIDKHSNINSFAVKDCERGSLTTKIDIRSGEASFDANVAKLLLLHL